MIQKVIAIAVITSYFVVMLLGKNNRNTLFIGFVLLAYPFMGIDLLPSLFSFRIFDFVTLSFLLLFYQKRIKCNNYPNGSPILSLSFFAIVAVFVLNAVNGGELNHSFYLSALQLISIIIFVRIVYDEFIFDKSLIEKVAQWFKVMMIFSLCFLMFQVLFGTSFTFSKSPNVNIEGGIVTRYPSFFQDPQKYAQFLSALSFPVLLIRSNNQRISISTISIFIASFIALLYTGGRSALFGWLAGIALLLVFMTTRLRFILIIFLSLSIGVLYLFQDDIPVLNRASVEDSYSFRNEIWSDAYRIFLKYPVTGIGFGEYANYVAIHNPDQFWISENEVTYFDHPESGYLKLMVEFGIIGFIPILIFILYPIISGIKAFITNRKLVDLVLSVSLITWVIGFSTVYSLGDIRIAILVIILSAYLVSLSATKSNHI